MRAENFVVLRRKPVEVNKHCCFLQLYLCLALWIIKLVNKMRAAVSQWLRLSPSEPRFELCCTYESLVASQRAPRWKFSRAPEKSHVTHGYAYITKECTLPFAWCSLTTYADFNAYGLESLSDELSELLTQVGPDIVADTFIACGNVNCPGDCQVVVSWPVLDVYGLRQFVASATRHTSSSSSLLDIVIASCTMQQLQQVTLIWVLKYPAMILLHGCCPSKTVHHV